MVGFLLMKTPASLSLLFVHPSYLGRGIGRFVQKLEPSWKGSMLTDLERGKPIEIASLAGYVHRAGKLLGVATPFHSTAFRALCFHAQAR